MPVTRDGLRVTPYNVEPVPDAPATHEHQPGVPLAPPIGAGLPSAERFTPNHHVAFNWQSCRGTLQLVALAGDNTRHVRVQRAAAMGAGDTICLPFRPNWITSMRLPPPAAVGMGVTLFVTDAMSGCRFFVDTIAGSNDLMVYHANTTNFGPGQNDWANEQQGAALDALRDMRVAARGDYPGVGLVHGGDVAKPRYFRQAGERERAKNTWGRNLTPSQDFVRTRPEFQGGTAVVGLPVAGAWQFWFQTWGDVTYERMNSAKAVAAAIIDWKSIHRRIWSGKKHQASYATMAVVDHGRFYP